MWQTWQPRRGGGGVPPSLQGKSPGNEVEWRFFWNTTHNSNEHLKSGGGGGGDRGLESKKAGSFIIGSIGLRNENFNLDVLLMWYVFDPSVLWNWKLVQRLESKRSHIKQMLYKGSMSVTVVCAFAVIDNWSLNGQARPCNTRLLVTHLLARSLACRGNARFFAWTWVVIAQVRVDVWFKPEQKRYQIPFTSRGWSDLFNDTQGPQTNHVYQEYAATVEVSYNNTRIHCYHYLVTNWDNRIHMGSRQMQSVLVSVRSERSIQCADLCSHRK